MQEPRPGSLCEINFLVRILGRKRSMSFNNVHFIQYSNPNCGTWKGNDTLNNQACDGCRRSYETKCMQSHVELAAIQTLVMKDPSATRNYALNEAGRHIHNCVAKLGSYRLSSVTTSNNGDLIPAGTFSTHSICEVCPCRYSFLFTGPTQTVCRRRYGAGGLSSESQLEPHPCSIIQRLIIPI